MNPTHGIPCFSVLCTPLFLSGRAAAHNYLAATVKPIPPGKLIVANNGPGDQYDPHVSGDLGRHSNTDSIHFTIRHLNARTKGQLL